MAQLPNLDNAPVNLNSFRDDFRDYADICFKEFGHYVKHWITINEPWSFSYLGYQTGNLAPGLGSLEKYMLWEATQKNKASSQSKMGSRENEDDNVRHHSSILPPSRFLPPPLSAASEIPAVVQSGKVSYPVDQYPYIVTHHQLLAHAKAVDLYRQKYQVLIGHYIITAMR